MSYDEENRFVSSPAQASFSRAAPANGNEETSHSVAGTTFDSVLKELRKSGVNATSEKLITTDSDVQSINTPPDQLWNFVMKRFYSAVEATTEELQVDSFRVLMNDLILNTTSDKRDYSRQIIWPSGASVSIQNALEIPSGYTMRNFMSHSQAQLMATAIMMNPANSTFVQKVRAKNGYSKSFPPSSMFDFVNLGTNKFARNDQLATFKARDNKTFNTRNNVATAYKRVSGGNSGLESAGEIRESYHENLY